MSCPTPWKDYQKWLKGDSPDEGELKEQLQKLSRSSDVHEFLQVFQTYLSFLRYQETARLMPSCGSQPQQTYSAALNRLEGDVEKLIKGKLHA